MRARENPAYGRPVAPNEPTGADQQTARTSAGPPGRTLCATHPKRSLELWRLPADWRQVVGFKII